MNDGYKLFLALLEPDTINKGYYQPDIMLTTKAYQSLGDAAYADKAARILQKKIPSLIAGIAIDTFSSEKAKRINKIFSNNDSQHYWLKEGGDPKNAALVLSTAQFILMLGAVTDYAVEPLEHQNGFFIGASVSELESNHGCEALDLECRSHQIAWIYGKIDDTSKKYAENVLGMPFYDVEGYDQRVRGFAQRLEVEGPFSAYSHHIQNKQSNKKYRIKPNYYYRRARLSHPMGYCTPKYKFISCYLVPRFGLAPHNAGILVDPELDSTVRQFEQEPGNSDFVRALEDLPKVIRETLTGKENEKEQIDTLLAGADYYFTYFHYMSGKLEFIASLAKAYPGKNQTIIMPCSEKDIGSTCTYNLASIALGHAGVSTVKLWTKTSNEPQTITLQESQNGITLNLVDPGFLPHKTMMALMYLSNPVVGVSGDNSLSEALVMGKLPYPEALPHNLFTRTQLGLLSSNKELNAFYNNLDPVSVGAAWKILEENPDIIKSFARTIVDTRNASHLLSAIASSVLEPSFELSDFLFQVDQSVNAAMDTQAPGFPAFEDDNRHRADIVRMKWLLAQFKVGYAKPTEPDQRQEYLKSMREEINKISSQYLRRLMDEALYDYVKEKG
ncbi:hypothetical protein NX722_27115 [Endozoicomonas gorgoniicola]|uniref:Uncharacterized protein n=1 Tax=Endozoicomonas gorgoniicola TaxID=1234144 RepID=A0ABT3N3M7_9GAMM|nr:hypothetical protein [Endozoicomonas gorgoniicola]MCW7556234.1 hypothetical protein [Endozoicomonas gorgoniicola]